MPLDITGILRLAETGEMLELEIEPVEEVPLIEVLENDYEKQRTVTSVLQEAPEEPSIPKDYKALATSIKATEGIPSEYSPEVIAQQLKDKMYPSKEKPVAEGALLGAYATFGVALTKIPRAVAAGILQAMQGMEGAVDEDWIDRFIDDANTDVQKFAQEARMRFGDKGFAGIKITDLAELPQNVGYSATSMLSGLAVGLPLSAVPLPGFRAAAWITGTAVSGVVAYRATTYQIMKQYLDIKNEESKRLTGVELTKEERLRLYNNFDELAHKYGMWEAVPEALSNLAFVGLLTAPLTKMVGKTIAGQIITKLGAMYGEELATETITQMGQAGIEVKVGMREGEAPDWTSPTDWIRAFKEVAPQTFLLTTFMAGAGTTVISTAKAVKDIKSSLRKEIGTEHPLYDGFSKKLGETKKPKVDIGTQYGEQPALAKDKKALEATTKDVSRLAELDKEEQTALMIPESPAKRITVGERPGVILTKTEVKKRAALTKKAIKKEKVDVCLRSMEKSGKISTDTSKKITRDLGFLNKIIKGSQVYWAGNRLIENLAGILDRTSPYGPNWKVITGDINEAENRKIEGIYSRTEALQGTLEKTFGRKKMVSLLTDRYDVGKFSLSGEDIIAVYQGTYDKGVLKHLKEGVGLTDKDIQQCVAIFRSNPKMQAVLKWGTERYSEDHAPLAKAYKEDTGKDLPKRPFFMHIVVDKETVTFKDDNICEQMMQREKLGLHAYVTKGITKPRVPSSRPINLGYVSNYLKYINEAENYKAYGQPIKNLSALLHNPRYRTAVTNNLNPASLQALDKYTKDIAGMRTGADLGTMDKVASLLRRHTGLVLIGMNVLSGFRQTLSGFNAAAEIGPFWMLRGIEAVMKDYRGSQKLIFSKSEQIKHRAGMWERFLAEEKRAEKVTQILTGKLTPRKMFMAFASAFDRLTVLAAAMGTYMKVTETGKLVDGTRLSNDEIERYAVLETDRVSRKTQPYVGAKDLPGWHRGGTIALMFTLFQNMANKVVNYADYDIVQKLRYGTTTPLQASEKLLFSVVLPALVLGMIARGRFPSIKEATVDIARFPLHGMFITGSMVNTIVSDYGEWSSPVLIGPQALAKTGKALTRGEWAKAGKFGIQTAAYALGVPYNQPYRTYKGLLALMNDETDDWRRLIWSDYALSKRKE